MSKSNKKAPKDEAVSNEKLNKIIDGALAQIKPVIKPEGGTGVMHIDSAKGLLRIDIIDLIASEKRKLIEEIQVHLGQLRQDENPTEDGVPVETYGYETTYNQALNAVKTLLEGWKDRV